MLLHTATAAERSSSRLRKPTGQENPSQESREHAPAQSMTFTPPRSRTQPTITSRQRGAAQAQVGAAESTQLHEVRIVCMAG